MARILGVSNVWLGKLSKQGALPDPVARGTWDVIATVQAYLRYREELLTSAGREVASDVKSEELRLTKARREKTEAERDAQAMKNAAMRGELLPRDAVTLAGQAVMALVRARLLAIPTRAAPRLLGVGSLPAVKDILAESVHDALAELASIEFVADTAATTRFSGADSDELDDGIDAATETDGERMGGPEPISQPRIKRGARPLEH